MLFVLLKKFFGKEMSVQRHHTSTARERLVIPLSMK